MSLFKRLFGRKVKTTDDAPEEPHPQTQVRPPQLAPPLRTTVASAPTRQVAAATPVAARRDASSDAAWIGPGQRIKIHGFEILGGMLYVGRGLNAPTGQTEPALINPDLTVSSKQSSSPDQDLGYWPGYSTITPENRGTYLAWLASGRRNPSVPIGYVFLFMYGLERRVLVDISAKGSLESELPAIRAEMTKLFDTYGPRSGSFGQYAANFIDVIDVILAQNMNRTLPPPVLRTERYAVPTMLLIELGRRAAHDVAIPADLALLWAWYHPENVPRTPATRCRDELAQLFAIRFAEKYPDGMAVRPGKARVRLSYFPASAGLRNVAMHLPDIPDIFAQKVPGKKLIELFDSVTNELDAYSRWLGRNPDGAGSLASVALLPPDLVAGSTSAVKPLREWANGQLGHRSVVKVPGAELVRMWPSATSDRLAKAEAVSLAQVLGHLGYGIEPDVRFGGTPVSGDAPIVLFRVPPDSPHSTTPAYNAATTLVHLAVAVGIADGDVSYQEIDHLGEHLESSLSLFPAEKARLHAHLMWLSTTEIKLNGLQKRLDGMNRPTRQSLGTLMISIAAADGVVSPSEVTILTKIFSLLDLDPNLVTSHLHASLTGSKPSPAVNPVTVRPGVTPEPGYRIPPRPLLSSERPAAMVGKSFSLDVAAIQEKLAATAEVSILLGNIFVDDDEAGSTQQPPGVSAQDVGTESVPGIAGMDGAHSLLLRAVAKRGEWSRAEFEDLAAEYHLMPDGAIDVLNEAAYDTTGEPVVEGDDVLAVNRYAIEGLLP